MGGSGGGGGGGEMQGGGEGRCRGEGGLNSNKSIHYYFNTAIKSHIWKLVHVPLKYHYCNIVQCFVRRTPCDWLVEQQLLRAGWKYVSMKHGALSVMMDGLLMMPT